MPIGVSPQKLSLPDCSESNDAISFPTAFPPTDVTAKSPASLICLLEVASKRRRLGADGSVTVSGSETGSDEGEDVVLPPNMHFISGPDGELASDEELASDGCKMRAANTDHSGDARVSDAELRAALEVVYAGGLDLHH